MTTYRLGDRVHDVTERTLVMGILNRTPDSFYDAGLTYELDALVRRAEQLVVDGADLLDVGGVKAGPGPEVGEAEELERVVPAIEALHARLDVAISVDTWRSSVLAEACRAGAVASKSLSRSSTALCVGVLPRSSPASIAICSGSRPAASAWWARSTRNLVTSPTRSS